MYILQFSVLAFMMRESKMHEMKPIYHNEMQSTTNKTKTKKIIDKKVKIIGLMNVQSS